MCSANSHLKWCSRWSLGMDKLFHPTLFWACNYLSMLGLKLNHVSKRGHSSDKTNEIQSFLTTCHYTVENYQRSTKLMITYNLPNWLSQCFTYKHLEVCWWVNCICIYIYIYGCLLHIRISRACRLCLLNTHAIILAELSTKYYTV